MITAAKSPLIERWFAGYCRRYFQRSFHTVHLLGEMESFQPDGRTPLLVYLNHSSWWDLLVCPLLNDMVLHWDAYGVMDERQLERYRMFRRIGVIGIDRTSLRGAKEFLTYATALLKNQPRALCLTPQGEMVSTEARPVRFQPGLGHLAEALEEFYLLSVAVEFEFWTEKQPELFLSLSPIRRMRVGADWNRKAFMADCERRLEAQLDSLRALRLRRDPALFRPLVQGRGGISPVYDTVRAVGARLSGKRFLKPHGAVVTEPYRRGRGENV